MKLRRKPQPQTDAQLIERVRSRCVVTGAGCWQSTVPPNKWGYTQTSANGKRWMTHRLMYTLLKGSIPDGHDVLHRCDNPPCCNPDHLWTGTQRENSLDMVSKGRTDAQQRPTCKRGHPYNDENTSRYGKNRWRDCKVCARIRQRMKSLGWPRELAETLPVTPKGYRPVNPR